MGRRFEEVVLVKLRVAVAPVQRPPLADLRVAADREPSSLRSEFVPPGRPAFEHRDRPVGDVDLEAQLVANMRRQVAAPLVDLLADTCEIKVGDHSTPP